MCKVKHVREKKQTSCGITYLWNLVIARVWLPEMGQRPGKISEEDLRVPTWNFKKGWGYND